MILGFFNDLKTEVDAAQAIVRSFITEHKRPKTARRARQEQGLKTKEAKK